MANSKYTYVKEFETFEKCLPNCWIVVRVDGKGYSKFAEKHKFKKPNDWRSLRLMNLSAKKVMKDFSDVVLAYGQSDEYSFVFKKDTKVYNRRPQKLVSIIASTFTSHFIMSWGMFFPDVTLTMPPVFDARVVLIPTNKNLRDYLAWRQVDLHINNLYNTCFWNLVNKKNLTPNEAENQLKGTVSADKHEILHSELGINYNNEPEEFKKGTLLLKGRHRTFDNFHVDIIKDQFWENHKYILDPNQRRTSLLIEPKTSDEFQDVL